MNTIKAHWCYMNNFGDALNPYILSKLSGKPVEFCNYETPAFGKEIMHMLKSWVRFRFYDCRRLTLPQRDKKVILAVGSILSRSLPNFQIWGAGFMNEFEQTKGGELFAVRGRYTAKKLESHGYPYCEVFGDPALLLPVIYQKNPTRENVVGIIPHMKEYEYFKSRYPETPVVKLATNQIEATIDLICQCQYIVSTSLHGLIVAHAYGIPAILAKYGDIDTDGFKFNDYFSSVDIDPYEGFRDIDPIIAAPEAFFAQCKEIVLPKMDVNVLQKKLLMAAPFLILDKYKESARGAH